jgi:probable rRNA maturation factor
MKRRATPRGKRGKSLVKRAASRPLPPLSFENGEGQGEGLPGDEQVFLAISNRQRTRPVNVRWLRQLCTALLNDLLKIQNAELGISLVTELEMTRVNKAFLQHAGSTDVITFDHAEPETRNAERGNHIHGELFICVDEAILQARRFRTTWQSEVCRYIIHGILHLLGYDDHRAADRHKMKRKENRLLHQLAARFALSRLARKLRLRG